MFEYLKTQSKAWNTNSTILRQYLYPELLSPEICTFLKRIRI